MTTAMSRSFWWCGAQGTHRSKSRTTPGHDRDLLRDEDDLRGPSESRAATAADVEEHLGVRSWEMDSQRSAVELTPGPELLGFTRESHAVPGAVELLEPQPPRELSR